MLMDESSLSHYGTPRHSGRYPWGSGGEESARNRDFLGFVEDLQKKGFTEQQIITALGKRDSSYEGMKSTEFRARKTIARNERAAARQTQAVRLRNTGMSYEAIAKEMGLKGESIARSLVKASENDKVHRLQNTVSVLREQADNSLATQIGSGVEHYIGVTRTMLDAAVAYLRNEGYNVFAIKTPQLGTKFETTVKVLAKPGVTYGDVSRNRDQITLVNSFTTDGGRIFSKIQPPKSIDSGRVAIRYAEDGGADMDGVMYVRPGVKDVSIGTSRYAQVRVAVDGTHYLKGMAVYKDDLPKGVDIMFNTNKSNTGNKYDAMKKMETLKDGSIDKENPFGTNIRRQLIEKDSKGKDQVTSVMNILSEEGTWDKWTANLSSQMLSKQSPKLAKQQLDMMYERRKNEYDEIMALTNPVIKRKLLQAFSDKVDADAVKLHAAGMPRTAQRVILPITSLKDNEVYAPQYKNGERVVLIRHPHGGTFEIPELVVNNRNAEGRKILGDVEDAVGINPRVAQKLSGADFDGDTVLVIPNNQGQIKASPSLKKLQDFDPKVEYKGYPGMPRISDDHKQKKMGEVSNLITDMTIKRASQDEIVRAVRHSMVVIDAEKHNLNWKQSEIDNGIAALKKKYQTKPDGSSGASTLISRAGSPVYVPQRVTNRPFIVDPKTGRRIPNETGKTTVDRKGNVVVKVQKSKLLAETDDARRLSSGTQIESVYATHSNSMKALANQARRDLYGTKNIPYDSNAAKIYKPEVDQLVAALNRAQKNAPLERQAQLLGNAMVSAKIRANPNLDDDDKKDLKFRALEDARAAVGADRFRISITPKQWEAIQAGAVSNSRLTQIIDNADLKQIQEYATPRTKILMTSSYVSRARTMLAQGYTQAEVAEQLGVSLTTLKNSLV